MEADRLKLRIFELTNVPPARQKIMGPGLWKGALKDGVLLEDALALKPGQSELTLMLMGSADQLADAPSEPVVFAEDLSPADVAAPEAAAAAAAAEKAEGMIAALQMVPGPERDESRALMSNLPVKYNHFVHGLSQQQIEDELRRRRERGRLLDVCAMTLGHVCLPATKLATSAGPVAAADVLRSISRCAGGGQGIRQRGGMRRRRHAGEWPRQWPRPALASRAANHGAHP